jgi:fermentation-respiration switch protein FrsA (DUF1100 family)
VLHFVSPHLATSYFLLAFVTIVGVLQLVAARHRLVGLTLVGKVMRPVWGYLVAAVLIVGAFAWFFATTPEVFTPGLAGSELAVLFGAAGICALAFTLLISSTVHGVRNRGNLDPKANSSLRHETVSLQLLRGTLYLPDDDTREPRPAICALPGSSERTLSPHPLVTDLLKEGFIVLAIDWGPGEEIRYPAILGLLPSAVAYLMRRDDVNPGRIGVLGVDLGGDLAIRSAGTDQQIATVLALAPFLDRVNTQPGLSILKEMSYLEAIRWARPLRLHGKRGELVAELAPLDYFSKIGSRPVLLVYGERDGITPAEGVRAILGRERAQGRLKSLPGEGHLSLPNSPAMSALAARWFKENL